MSSLFLRGYSKCTEFVLGLLGGHFVFWFGVFLSTGQLPDTAGKSFLGFLFFHIAPLMVLFLPSVGKSLGLLAVVSQLMVLLLCVTYTRGLVLRACIGVLTVLWLGTGVYLLGTFVRA